MPRLDTHPPWRLAASGRGATPHAIPCSEPSPVERKLQKSQNHNRIRWLRITSGVLAYRGV